MKRLLIGMAIAASILPLTTRAAYMSDADGDPRYSAQTSSTLDTMRTTTRQRHARKRTRSVAVDANGNLGSGVVRSSKTGATARVGAAYAAKFQAYIDDLESNHGATIKFMGGTRRGKCWPGGMHPCGKALDVCQLRRGVVDGRCHLPSRHELARVAAAHGLFEGGQWCNSDYGHAQVGVSAAACGSSTRMASARRHHRHVRLARR